MEGLVSDDDSVRLLSKELEDLDYTLLYRAYSTKGRNPVVNPKTMFKILTYAYSQNIYSSRKIEKACLRDINFMWLLAGNKAPDHTTIARFRTGFLAEACANKYTFVWRKSVTKWEERMLKRMDDAVQLLNHEYMKPFVITVETRTTVLNEIVEFLSTYCTDRNLDIMFK